MYLINCSFHVFVFVLASHYQTYPYNLSTIWCVIIKTLATFGLAVKKIIKQLVIMNYENSCRLLGLNQLDLPLL